jgi:hypothetical protein
MQARIAVAASISERVRGARYHFITRRKYHRSISRADAALMLQAVESTLTPDHSSIVAQRDLASSSPENPLPDLRPR